MWQILYDELAIADALHSLLGNVESPVYEPARVYGRKMEFWQSIYREFLLELSGHGRGMCVLVEDKRQEEGLQSVETHMYKAVRCDNHMRESLQPAPVFIIMRSDVSLLILY